MADDEVAARKRLEEERKKKQAFIDAKKAEVRARLEQAAAQKKGKKGFMTPERKKKLRLLLRKKAAEELKKEQERKAAERRRIIEERCGKPKNVDDASEADDLKAILGEYNARIGKLEEAKYDLEYATKVKDYEINELNIQVNDLRGKFVKPTLKKVSKYENKFAKLQKKAAEFNFKNQLKQVKKKEFTMEDEDEKDRVKKDKPEWTKAKDAKVATESSESAEVEAAA